MVQHSLRCSTWYSKPQPLQRPVYTDCFMCCCLEWGAGWVICEQEERHGVMSSKMDEEKGVRVE